MIYHVYLFSYRKRVSALGRSDTPVSIVKDFHSRAPLALNILTLLSSFLHPLFRPESTLSQSLNSCITPDITGWLQWINSGAQSAMGSAMPPNLGRKLVVSGEKLALDTQKNGPGKRIILGRILLTRFVPGTLLSVLYRMVRRSIADAYYRDKQTP